MLIDIHCHANLYPTLDEIVNDAQNSNVMKIIAVAMSYTSLERILEISAHYESIYPALGIHPEEISQNKKIEMQLDSILDLIKNNSENICAIGEIGLDHHFVKDKTYYPIQKKVFEEMLSLAQEIKLPVNIHSKGAELIVFDLLSSYDIPNINIHWYSGPEKFLKEGIDRGYYFSITPAIKYSTAVRNVALNVDNQHLLLESDGPVKYSGVTGTPSMINEVFRTISEIKNTKLNELEIQIEENTKNIFPKIF